MVATHPNILCMFTPTAGGGHARYTMELLTALDRSRANPYRVELVTSGDLEREFRAVPYPTHAILPPILDSSRFRTRFGWAWNRLTHYARRERAFESWLASRPDIAAVHVQEWVWWLGAAMLRRIRRSGRRVFLTVHNVYPHKYPRLFPRAVVDSYRRRACAEADVLFVHSKLLADELHKYLGGRAHPPIHVIPHGVWTVPADEQAVVPMRERLSWKKLLFFGTIRSNKGLELLLRAAHDLPDYQITVAGQPEDEYFNGIVLPLVRDLQAKGRKIEVIDRFVDEAEAHRLFRTHSALVLPYTDAFLAQSGVIYLALAHGIPVVAREVGGLRDLLAAFRIGTSFVQQTPAALAGAVRELFERENPEALSEQIRLASEHNSWDAAARATVAGYISNNKPSQETVQRYDRRAQTVSAL